MRPVLPLLLAIWGAIPAQAACPPQVAWLHAYNNGLVNGEDRALGAALDAQGNVIIVGFDTSNGGTSAGLVAKYDPQNNAVWSPMLRIAGPGSATSVAHAVAVDPVGNVVVAGEADGALLLNKYASDGNLRWSRSYAPAAGGSATGLGVATDAAGFIFVAGYEIPAAAGEGRNWLVQKYGPAGFLLWTRTTDNPSTADDDAALAVAVDTAGSVYVTGYAVRSDLGQSANWVTRKYRTNGGLLWETGYNSPANGWDQAAGIAVAPDGTVVVAGRETRPDLGEGSNVLVQRYDAAAGGVLTTRSFDSPAHQDDDATSVAVDGDGNVYVAGSQQRGDLGQGLNWLALKFNEAFALLWQFTINTPANGDDTARAVAVGGGHIIVAGDHDRSDLSQGHDWLTENLTDPLPCPADIAASAPSPVAIYPNPVGGDQCTAAFRLLQDASDVTIEVYDLDFRVVYKGAWHAVPMALDGVTISGISRWSPGLYFLKVRATLNDGSKQVFDAARLVVRR